MKKDKSEKKKSMSQAEVIAGLRLFNEMVEEFLDRMDMDACEDGKKDEKEDK